MKRLLGLLLIVSFFASVALAASRTWTSGNGRFSTEAELLGFKDGKVQLKKTDGKVIDVPLHLLSAADQEYVKKQYPESAEPLPPGEEEEESEAAPADEPAAENAENCAAQDIAMKLLRLDLPRRKSRGKPALLSEYVLRLTQPQQFIRQRKQGDADEAEFRRVVKKEPKYVCPIPFRGVAKLGSGQFGFALDAVAPKAVGYDKLYFDADGNGDLTDDAPVSATEATPLGANMSQSQFPRVGAKLELGGQPVEYAFLLSAVCRQSGDNFHAAVSLYTAVAREGYLRQGKRRVKVMLVDRNSNGRFDDLVSVGSNGNIAEGDLLLMDPNPKKGLASIVGAGSNWNLVGKVICVGKGFFGMTVEPDGSKLQLKPIQISLGFVAGSGPAYRAVLTSDDYGVVAVAGTKEVKVALAEGTWKLVNYAIDATAAGGGRRTSMEAAFGNSPPQITVKKGETAALPLGGPFRAVVTAARTDKTKVFLRLEIVGAAGERCRSMYVNGGKPPKPHFVIKDQNDKIVYEGDFEYG